MSTVKHAQSLDQIHNDITGLKLELEIVHNKKKLLQDDRWERSYYKDENQVIFRTRQWFISYYLANHSDIPPQQVYEIIPIPNYVQSLACVQIWYEMRWACKRLNVIIVIDHSPSLTAAAIRIRLRRRQLIAARQRNYVLMILSAEPTAVKSYCTVSTITLRVRRAY